MNEDTISAIQLFLSLFSPVFISYITATYLDRKANGKRSISEIFTLDHRSLYKQGWFIATATSGTLYTFIFMGWAVFGRKVDLSAEGFEVFITDSQLAIGILTAASILLVLISRLHASHQTEMQLREAERKNNIEIRLIHKNEFKTELEERIVSTADTNFINKNLTFSSFFIERAADYDGEKFYGNIDFMLELSNYNNIFQNSLLTILNYRNQSNYEIIDAIYRMHDAFGFLKEEMGLANYIVQQESGHFRIGIINQENEVTKTVVQFHGIRDCMEKLYVFESIYSAFTETIKGDNDLLGKLKVQRENSDLRIEEILIEYRSINEIGADDFIYRCLENGLQ